MFTRYVVTGRRTGYPSLIIHPPYPVVPLVPLLDMGLTTSKNDEIHFYINGKVLYNLNSPAWRRRALVTVWTHLHTEVLLRP